MQKVCPHKEYYGIAEGDWKSFLSLEWKVALFWSGVLCKEQWRGFSDATDSFKNGYWKQVSSYRYSVWTADKYNSELQDAIRESESLPSLGIIWWCLMRGEVMEIETESSIFCDFLKIIWLSPAELLAQIRLLNSSLYCGRSEQDFLMESYSERSRQEGILIFNIKMKSIKVPVILVPLQVLLMRELVLMKTIFQRPGMNFMPKRINCLEISNGVVRKFTNLKYESTIRIRFLDIYFVAWEASKGITCIKVVCVWRLQ